MSLLRVAVMMLRVSLLATVSFAGTGGRTMAEAQALKTIVGEIRSVDSGRSLVTIQESTNAAGSGRKSPSETVVISVVASTQISRGKKNISLAELKPQDRVLASYEVTAQGLRAISIRAADLPTATPTKPPAPGR